MQLRASNLSLLGYFDILGYGAFLERNDVSDVVVQALELFSELPKCSHRVTQEFADSPSPFRTIIDSIKATLFSDTIVLTCPCPEEEPFPRALLRWQLFTFEASLIYRFLFDRGFPVRGAIAAGEYINRHSCFAGRALIAAHKLASSLDVAAIVLAESGVDWIRRKAPAADVSKEFLSSFFLPITVGLNDGGAREVYVLNIGRAVIPNTTPVKQLPYNVHAAFSMHGKDVEPARRKIAFTEHVLRTIAAWLEDNLTTSENRASDMLVRTKEAIILPRNIAE